jgi:putative selenium-binding protein YdfZ
MVFNKGLTGVIKSIHGEGKSAEQIRRSECVEIEGCEGMFSPMELVRLEFH